MRGVAVPPPLVRRLCNSTIRTTASVQLNMTVNVNAPKHRRSWWRTDITAVMSVTGQKSPRYFVECLEFSAVFQNRYLFYDLSRNSGWETLTSLLSSLSLLAAYILVIKTRVRPNSILFQ